MRPTLMIALFALALAGNAHEGSMEQQVLAGINAARANPEAYAATLRQYRTYFDDGLVRFPGNPVGLRTKEGVAAVDEAIAFLSRQAALPPLAHSPLLSQAAADHAADQGRSGRTGHGGQDGAGPGERVKRRGGGTFIAETISYGSSDAADVVRQLIVDDGVPSRGHRAVLFSPTYRYAGVGCGAHPGFRSMCVIDLSTTADGQYRDR